MDFFLFLLLKNVKYFYNSKLYIFYTRLFLEKLLEMGPKNLFFLKPVFWTSFSRILWQECAREGKSGEAIKIFIKIPIPSYNGDISMVQCITPSVTMLATLSMLIS